MKFNIKIITILLTLSPWFSVFSYQELVVSHNVCVYGKTEYRTVRVHQKTGVCDVIYTKWGKDKLIAVRKTENSCLKVFNNVKQNLQEAGWVCKEAIGSGFTVEST